MPQRMAGDKMKAKDYQVQGGKGKNAGNRFSGKDVQAMRDQGFNDNQIQKRADSHAAKGGKVGGFAQKKMDNRQQTKNINKYDAGQQGRGGANKWGQADINHLQQSGHSNEDIAKRMQAGVDSGGKAGAKAQTFLNKYMTQGTQNQDPNATDMNSGQGESQELSSSTGGSTDTGNTQNGNTFGQGKHADSMDSGPGQKNYAGGSTDVNYQGGDFNNNSGNTTNNETNTNVEDSYNQNLNQQNNTNVTGDFNNVVNKQISYGSNMGDLTNHALASATNEQLAGITEDSQGYGYRAAAGGIKMINDNSSINYGNLAQNIGAGQNYIAAKGKAANANVYGDTSTWDKLNWNFQTERDNPEDDYEGDE